MEVMETLQGWSCVVGVLCSRFAAGVKATFARQWLSPSLAGAQTQLGWGGDSEHVGPCCSPGCDLDTFPGSMEEQSWPGEPCGVGRCGTQDMVSVTCELTH